MLRAALAVAHFFWAKAAMPLTLAESFDLKSASMMPGWQAESNGSGPQHKPETEKYGIGSSYEGSGVPCCIFSDHDSGQTKISLRLPCSKQIQIMADKSSDQPLPYGSRRWGHCEEPPWSSQLFSCSSKHHPQLHRFRKGKSRHYHRMYLCHSECLVLTQSFHLGGVQSPRYAHRIFASERPSEIATLRC